MEKLPMCRICLVQNVRMYAVVNRNLQELYEKLTGVPFVTADSRPILACVFCCTKLKQCCRFMRKCLEAEELFAQMMNEDYEPNSIVNQDHFEFLGGFIKSPIENISINVVQTESIAIKEELPAVFKGPDDIIIELKVEHQTDELKLDNFDNSCLDVADIPPHISESDLEDEVPLMEFKTELEEEQEVSMNKRKAMETKIPEEKTKETPEIEENMITIELNSFNQMAAENNVSQAENKFLKESIQRFENLIKEENNKNFLKIQVQLDKIFDLVKSEIRYSARTDASTSKSDEHIKKIANSGITFPINTIEQLNLLEEKLIDEGFEKDLIKEFSSISGTSGKQKISKIGLNLARCLFTDKLLYQLTWKGIKGTQKVPLLNFIKIRHFFYKIVKLADSSCSAKDSDMFLQNSAIKHSGQRLKRKSSQEKISHPKKNKIESEMETTAKNKHETATNYQKCMTTENAKEPSNYNKKETITSENEKENTSNSEKNATDENEEDPFSTYSETIHNSADETKEGDIDINVQDETADKENKIGDRYLTHKENYNTLK